MKPSLWLPSLLVPTLAAGMLQPQSSIVPFVLPGPAIPQIEDWAESGSSTTTTSLTCTAPSGITADELLVIIVGNDDTNNAAEFTTTPSGWTKLGEGGNTASDAHVAVFYKIAAGSEGNVSITANSSREMFGAYLRVSGVNTTTPINVGPGTILNGGTNSVHTITGVTTTVDDCLAIAVGAFDGGDGDPHTTSSTGWNAPTGGADLDLGGTSVNAAGGFWFVKEMPTLGATGSIAVTHNVGDGCTGFQFAIAPV